MSLSKIITFGLDSTKDEGVIGFVKEVKEGDVYNALNPVEQDLIDYLYGFLDSYGCLPTRSDLKEDNEDLQIFILNSNIVRNGSVQKFRDDFYDQIRKREISKIVNDIQVRLSSGEAIDELEYISSIEAVPKKPIVAKSKSLSSMFDEFDDTFDGIDDHISYKTGLFDEETRGLKSGELMGILAATNVGKSNVSCFIATNRFLKGKKVVIFTYEEPVLKMFQRACATIGEFNTSIFDAPKGSSQADELKLKLKPKTLDLIKNLEMAGGVLHIKNGNNFYIRDIRRFLIDEYKRTGEPYDLVVIDGLYLVRHPSLDGYHVHEDNVNSLNQISLGFKNEITGDVELPPVKVIFTSQLDLRGELNLKAIAKSVTFAQTPDTVVGLAENPSGNGMIAKLLKVRGNGKNSVGHFEMNWDTNTLMRIKNQDWINIRNNTTSVALNRSINSLVSKRKIYPFNSYNKYQTLSDKLKRVWDNLELEINNGTKTQAEAESELQKELQKA